MAYAPNSAAARDVAYDLHPYTNLAVHEEKGPVIITRGEGVYVWDDEGNKYLEGLAGLWCVSLGFSEKRLMAAAARQFEELPFCHSFAHRASMPVIELAEKLVDVAPEPMAKAFFVNSGSEAIDAAIKFVWYYNNGLDRPEKKKIISRKRGYHGVTVAGASLTAMPVQQSGWDLPIERVLHTETPCHYRHGKQGESEEAFATRMAEELEALILEEGPETVAAFFAEPVMGAGGVIVPPATYFEKVQAVLKRHDVLFVADEVICGFGRTGNMWGSQTYDLRPDMITCAKQLSSGYLPIAAVLVSDQVYQAFVEQSRRLGVFGTGHTYGGHPVSAAVALETLRIYEEDDIVGHVRGIAPHFQARLSALAEHPLVGNTKGVGLIGGLEIVADKASKQSFPPARKAAQLVHDKTLAERVMLRPLPSDSIGVCPPLIIKENEIDQIYDALERGLDAAAAELL